MLYAVRITYTPQDTHSRGSAAEKTEGGVCASPRIDTQYPYPAGGGYRWLNLISLGRGFVDWIDLRNGTGGRLL